MAGVKNTLWCAAMSLTHCQHSHNRVFHTRQPAFLLNYRLKIY